MKYDVAYQEWRAARRMGDYRLADRIREDFERYHGLTIYADGDMPVIGVTVRKMRASAWQKKYGNPALGDIIATIDSKVKRVCPRYAGMSDRGYLYV